MATLKASSSMIQAALSVVIQHLLKPDFIPFEELNRSCIMQLKQTIAETFKMDNTSLLNIDQRIREFYQEIILMPERLLPTTVYPTQDVISEARVHFNNTETSSLVTTVLKGKEMIRAANTLVSMYLNPFSQLIQLQAFLYSCRFWRNVNRLHALIGKIFVLQQAKYDKVSLIACQLWGINICKQFLDRCEQTIFCLSLLPHLLEQQEDYKSLAVGVVSANEYVSRSYFLDDLTAGCINAVNSPPHSDITNILIRIQSEMKRLTGLLKLAIEGNLDTSSMRELDAYRESGFEHQWRSLIEEILKHEIKLPQSRLTQQYIYCHKDEAAIKNKQVRRAIIECRWNAALLLIREYAMKARHSNLSSYYVLEYRDLVSLTNAIHELFLLKHAWACVKNLDNISYDDGRDHDLQMYESLEDLVQLVDNIDEVLDEGLKYGFRCLHLKKRLRISKLYGKRSAIKEISIKLVSLMEKYVKSTNYFLQAMMFPHKFFKDSVVFCITSIEVKSFTIGYNNAIKLLKQSISRQESRFQQAMECTINSQPLPTRSNMKMEIPVLAYYFLPVDQRINDYTIESTESFIDQISMNHRWDHEGNVDFAMVVFHQAINSKTESMTYFHNSQASNDTTKGNSSTDSMERCLIHHIIAEGCKHFGVFVLSSQRNEAEASDNEDFNPYMDFINSTVVNLSTVDLFADKVTSTDEKAVVPLGRRIQQLLKSEIDDKLGMFPGHYETDAAGYEFGLYHLTVNPTNRVRLRSELCDHLRNGRQFRYTFMQWLQYERILTDSRSFPTSSGYMREIVLTRQKLLKLELYFLRRSFPANCDMFDSTEVAGHYCHQALYPVIQHTKRAIQLFNETIDKLEMRYCRLLRKSTMNRAILNTSTYNDENNSIQRQLDICKYYIFLFQAAMDITSLQEELTLWQVERKNEDASQDVLQLVLQRYTKLDECYQRLVFTFLECGLLTTTHIYAYDSIDPSVIENYRAAMLTQLLLTTSFNQSKVDITFPATFTSQLQEAVVEYIQDVKSKLV